MPSTINANKKNDLRPPSKKKKVRKVVIFILLAFTLIAIFIISSTLNTEEFIEKIGIRNGYILAFLVSFFAGFSSLTMVSFYGILITFASGGLNPVILALVAGTSLSLGDMFLFYFGRKGRDLIPEKLDIRINRVAHFFSHRRLEKYFFLVSYIYISFIPLPNDWLLLFLASIRYPQRRMNLIIILGDYTHVFILTFLTIKGIVFFG